MTIGAWVVLGIMTILLACGSLGVIFASESTVAKILAPIITVGLIFGMFGALKWYYTNTASGQRALIDQRSELNNGIDRTINVYTADGTKMATYTGKIDIDTNNGGYVKFDFEGKRYIYYNCFIETIADIK